jgi:uncharacterized membrane protein
MEGSKAMLYIKIYLTAFFLFFAIDLLWLGVIASNLYRSQIGFLMADEIRWGAALLFYALYLAGLVFFAILPALKTGSWTTALGYGCFFGLVCYATYDLTNLATLKNWPLALSLIDMTWGTVISGLTSVGTYLIISYFRGSGPTGL